MENKFKKGLLLGGLLAGATLVGLAMSKKGVALSDELQKEVQALTKKIKKQLAKLEDITQKDFDELVVKVVDEYAEAKAWVAESKETIIAALQDMWQEMEEDYTKDHDNT